MRMRSPRYGLAIVFALAWPGPLPAADKAPPPPTLLTERGKLLLADDFDRPLDKAWVVRAPDWETVDGASGLT
jgi:hypothetical protein